ncbi:MAG: NAD-binding protein [Candidatus Limnocylindria bacterium]
MHIGPHGAGQACKLPNQIAVAINNLGVAEALVFAAAQGLDLERARAVIAGGAGSSWAMVNYAPKMLDGDFRPAFMVDLQQKDLRLALDAAYGDHLSLPAPRSRTNSTTRCSATAAAARATSRSSRSSSGSLGSRRGPASDGRVA